ncbi:DUF2321 domain-containing protein [Desulfosporosinus orientis]|uniref:DUF2321 domain-containing protein n=1 Tax=Desulfosporosinus orientis TaxID=1563 RepID=UPI0002EC0864
MINQSSINNTENNTKDFETCGVKNISKCMKCHGITRGVQPSYYHECGTPHPWTSNRFKDLIKMVEYFELNPEDAEC